MRRLQNDIFARQERPRAQPVKVRPSLIVYVVAALALLGLSRIDHRLVRQLRAMLNEAAAPAQSVLSEPLARAKRGLKDLAVSADLAREIDVLRSENLALKAWQTRAEQLERKVGELERVAHAVSDAGLSFVTARVIADSSGPIVRVAMVNAGLKAGIKVGHPVTDASGLVGRVLEAGEGVSRLLLITDLNSRVPVLIGQSQTRAMLMGDATTLPKLGAVLPDAPIKVGDQVFTSGVGGLYPRGVRVGVVLADQPTSPNAAGPVSFRVQPAAQLAELDYVSVLLFDSPALEQTSAAATNVERRSGAKSAAKTAPAAAIGLDASLASR